MKKMSHFLVGFVGAVLVLGSASAVFAHGHSRAARPPHGGWGVCITVPHPMGKNFPELPEETRIALDALMQEHRSAVEPLREQLEARYLELNALSGSSNARPADISRLAKEVAELRARIRSMDRDFREKIHQELGGLSGPWAGMMGRHGMRGPRHMRGCGW